MQEAQARLGRKLHPPQEVLEARVIPQAVPNPTYTEMN